MSIPVNSCVSGVAQPIHKTISTPWTSHFICLLDDQVTMTGVSKNCEWLDEGPVPPKAWFTKWMSALDIAAQIHYTNLSVFSAPKEKTETNVASCCHHSESNSHLLGWGTSTSGTSCSDSDDNNSTDGGASKLSGTRQTSLTLILCGWLTGVVMVVGGNGSVWGLIR